MSPDPIKGDSGRSSSPRATPIKKTAIAAAKTTLAIAGGATIRLSSSRSAATVSTRNASHQPADFGKGRSASQVRVPNPQHSAAIEGITASKADCSRRMFQSDAAASAKLAVKNATPAKVIVRGKKRDDAGRGEQTESYKRAVD